MTEQQIADVLAECLSAIERGHTTPEACLRMYPDYRRELYDMFLAVGLLRSAPRVTPSPVFREFTKLRVLNRATAIYPEKPAPAPAQLPARRGFFGLFAARRTSWAWAGALGLLLLLIIFGSSTVSYAASSSVPGDALYGLKVFINDIQISRAQPARQAELHIQLANQNLAEMQYLATANRYDDFGIAALSFQQHAIQAGRAIAALHATDSQAAAGLEQQLNLTLSNHTNVLTVILSYAPSSARPAIEDAMLIAANTPDPTPAPQQPGSAEIEHITICHKPGTVDLTLVLPPHAVLAHESHGDLLGACGPQQTGPDSATDEPPAAPTGSPTAAPPLLPPATPASTPVPGGSAPDEPEPLDPAPAEPEQVTICHQTGSEEVTISISTDALAAHFDHGDYLGECPDPPESSTGPGNPGGKSGNDDEADDSTSPAAPSPKPTHTPKPTNTPRPTNTPKPTKTPRGPIIEQP